MLVFRQFHSFDILLLKMKLACDAFLHLLIMIIEAVAWNFVVSAYKAQCSCLALKLSFLIWLKLR